MLISYVAPESDEHYPPWIARVIGWERKPVFEWGTPSKDRAVIEAAPGEILCWGRKHILLRASIFNFGVVMADGEILPISRAAAYNHFRRHEWTSSHPSGKLPHAATS